MLVGREEVEVIAAVVLQRADAGGVKAGQIVAHSGHGLDLLRHAAGDVRTGRYDFGLYATVAARAATGKPNDVVGAIGFIVARVAAVKTGRAGSLVRDGV